MVIRYFVVQADDTKGHKTKLKPQKDCQEIAEVQSIIIGELADGRKIVKVVLPDYIIKEFAFNTHLEDPLTLEGVTALDIGDKYVGQSMTDVLTMFPELSGQVEVGTDEKGNPIKVNRLKRTRFLGE